ncbi:hypothetical protein C5167_036719 [Papaver somniferum]|uniref:Uncharacterized protein n=1 Tax=Papaver somniferum TaxID=3469 RepID=A0A4Y7I811_PAPSO|nr:hypothetical protein C5167_036719 [Papaver somniferum]
MVSEVAPTGSACDEGWIVPTVGVRFSADDMEDYKSRMTLEVKGNKVDRDTRPFRLDEGVEQLDIRELSAFEHHHSTETGPLVSLLDVFIYGMLAVVSVSVEWASHGTQLDVATNNGNFLLLNPFPMLSVQNHCVNQGPVVEQGSKVIPMRSGEGIMFAFSEFTPLWMVTVWLEVMLGLPTGEEANLDNGCLIRFDSFFEHSSFKRIKCWESTFYMFGIGSLRCGAGRKMRNDKISANCGTSRIQFPILHIVEFTLALGPYYVALGSRSLD